VNRRLIRQKVLLRDGPICCYCNLSLRDEDISLEHITPDSQGGEFRTTNLTIACKDCNFKRGNKPFFDFPFKPEQIEKYQRLYQANLQIRVLNLSKEQLHNYYEVPERAIEKVCQLLNIEMITYQALKEPHQFQRRNDIIVSFEQLIRDIEGSI
jgi:hypothetical protein